MSSQMQTEPFRVVDSLWAKTAQSAPETHSLSDGISQADVVVIGAGFTGLRAALELATSGRNIIVVEAGEIGWGASGRSGGQVNPIMRLTSDRVASLLGAAAAARLIKATINSADEVFELIQRHEIECDAVQKGWLQVAHCTSAADSLTALAKDWRQFGADIVNLHDTETQKLTGSPVYRSGLLHPRAGHLHPLSYVRGLANAAVGQGVRIFTGDAATELRQDGKQWAVTVGQATIHAQHVLLCTNAYTSGLDRKVDRSYLSFTPIQLATEVLDPGVYAATLPDERTIADTRRLIFYGRKTGDGRLVFGGLGKNINSQHDYARIKKEAVRIFPQLSGVRWEYNWGGNIAMTMDALPHIHQVAPGLLAAIGCNGRGVAMGTVMGRVLSEFITDPSKEPDVAISPVKPIWLRQLKSSVIPYGIPILGLMDRLDKSFSSETR